MLKQLKRTAAVLRIQAEFRWKQRSEWLARLAQGASSSDEQKTNFCKHVQVRLLGEKKQLPVLLGQMARQHWACRTIAQINGDDRRLMRQKVVALTLFQGKKPWDPTRPFQADYVADLPHVEVYKQQIQNLFSSGGDSVINFSSDTIKVNRKGASQHQAIIVSDAHIYKYWPGKWKMIKEGIPLSAIQELVLSPHKDTFMVIKMKSPYRDMVLDMGVNGFETYSELASTLMEICSQDISVSFSDSISFDNGRTTKSPGKQRTITFQSTGMTKTPKMPSGCQLKFSGTGAVVNY
jgi:hypothetical protein